DPTSVVAPEQIEQRDAPDPFPSVLARLGLSKLFKNLEFGWDALNNQWNVWFFSYSFYRQKRLLTNLGIDLDSWLDPITLIGMIAGITGIFILGFVFLAWRWKRIPRDSVQSAYNRFCRKLARIGFPRGPAEGPADYAGRVSGARRDLAEEIQAITELYILLRYGRGGEEDTLKSFKTMVKRFRTTKLSGNEKRWGRSGKEKNHA
ncbi:MAG TPA: DUF4129 domain-containing protein, partial [bacterium]|nr:DUF4129 domain-containing protein [bacterium]